MQDRIGIDSVLLFRHFVEVEVLIEKPLAGVIREAGMYARKTHHR